SGLLRELRSDLENELGSVVAANFFGTPVSLVLMPADREAVPVVDLSVADAIPPRGTFVVIDVARVVPSGIDIVEVDAMGSGIEERHGAVELRFHNDAIASTGVIHPNGA